MDQNNSRKNEVLEPISEETPTRAEPRNEKLKWYVVHTHSGLENRAVIGLQERMKQYGLEDQFGEIFVPSETVEEIKGGVRKTQQKKCFPGYILVEMDLDDKTWHLVRNTPKISGFVGATKNPLPLRLKEVERLRQMQGQTVQRRAKIEFNAGEQVKITEGPFANFNATIEEVHTDKQKLRVTVSIFGRATPVELDFMQVEKVA